MLKKETAKIKKLLLIVLILGLFTSYGRAQMTGQNSEMGRGMMDWGYGIGGGWNDPYNLVEEHHEE